MAKQIWKYALPDIGKPIHFEFPPDSRFMSIGPDPKNPTMPCLWLEVDDELAATEPHVFKVYGTGHELAEPEDERHFVGTAVCGPFAWHIFEVPTEEGLKAEREYKAKLMALAAESAGSGTDDTPPWEEQPPAGGEEA